MRTVLSSAEKIKNRRSDAQEKPFMNTIKNCGPSIGPWSTPWEMHFVLNLLLLYRTN